MTIEIKLRADQRAVNAGLYATSAQGHTAQLLSEPPHPSAASAMASRWSSRSVLSANLALL